MVQWVRLQASTAGGVGLIPGPGSKIFHDVWHGQKIIKRAETQTGFSRGPGAYVYAS